MAGPAERLIGHAAAPGPAGLLSSDSQAAWAAGVFGWCFHATSKAVPGNKKA